MMKLHKKVLQMVMVALASVSMCLASVSVGWSLSRDKDSDAARIGDTPNLVNNTFSNFDNYYIYLVADGKPLFTPDGHNGDVALELYQIISEAGSITKSTHTAQTTDHMSQWVLQHNNVPEEQWASDDHGAAATVSSSEVVDNHLSARLKSGAVFVRLFDATGQTGVVKDIAERWWQVVYTSQETDEEPIITFFMVDQYRGPTRFHNTGTTNPGYSASSVRSTINADYTALATAFPDLDNRTIYPSALPGLWQSQSFQTGSATAGQSPFAEGGGALYTQNGMNASGTTGTGAYMADKMWLPSGFETLHMGIDNEPLGTVMSGHVSSANSMNNPATLLARGHHRTGLWRLNGFDRAMTEPESGTGITAAWLRNRISNSNNNAGVIHWHGGHWDRPMTGGTSDGNQYVRPGMHLQFTEDLIETFTVDFVSNSSTHIESQEELPFNALVIKPTDPIVVGQRLEGWYTQSNFASGSRWDFETSTVTEDVTLYARWISMDNLTVTFNSSGGTPATATSSVQYNGMANKPADPTKVGQTFVAWYSDAELTNVWNFETQRITQNTTLYARWTNVGNLSVTFNSNGGVPATTIRTAPLNGTVDKPTDPIKVGMNFAGWYSDMGLTQVWNFSTAVTTNITLYARWTEAAKLTVTLESNGGSVVAPFEALLHSKLNNNFIPTKEGYKFAGWFTDPDLTAAWNFDTSTVTQDIKLYAKWTEIIEKEPSKVPLIVGIVVGGGLLLFGLALMPYLYFKP
jgi:uncharacterized repeat protein (TIGR02543 family)